MHRLKARKVGDLRTDRGDSLPFDSVLVSHDLGQPASELFMPHDLVEMLRELVGQVQVLSLKSFFVTEKLERLPNIEDVTFSLVAA
jgi:hypothetical protein